MVRKLRERRRVVRMRRNMRNNMRSRYEKLRPKRRRGRVLGG